MPLRNTSGPKRSEMCQLSVSISPPPLACTFGSLSTTSLLAVEV